MRGSQAVRVVMTTWSWRTRLAAVAQRVWVPGGLSFVRCVRRRVGASVAGIASLVVAMSKTIMPASIAPDHRYVLSLQLALFVAGGVGALALAFTDFLRNRDANSALLLMWVLGTWVFASFVNWGVNARSVLPMIPAVGILLARRLEALRSFTGKRRMAKLVAPLAVSAAAAIWVTWGDDKVAKSARAGAAYEQERLRRHGSKGTFEGR